MKQNSCNAPSQLAAFVLRQMMDKILLTHDLTDENHEIFPSNRIIKKNNDSSN